MAEESDLEKTEEASPRKLEKAREEGDVPRSKELATFSLLLAATAGFWFSGANMIHQLRNLLQHSLKFQTNELQDFKQFAVDLLEQLLELTLTFLPFIGLLMFAAIGSPALIGGWLFNSKALAPKFSKLNPLQGLGNMFSKNALVELAKAVIKTSLISVVAWIFLRSEFENLFAMPTKSLENALDQQGYLLLISFTILVAALAIVAIIDVPYQIYHYGEKLKMTRQELRDEAKESEGNPEIKAKIRAQQREMARRRMMSQVPTADVVITNPTHYAVALKYPDNSDRAPYVIAKGTDHNALRIRELALENRIVVMEAPPLARALYQHTELEDEIPASLYTAVAQVLAYVFQLRDWQSRGGLEPTLPEFVPIPAGLDPLNDTVN